LDVLLKIINFYRIKEVKFMDAKSYTVEVYDKAERDMDTSDLSKRINIGKDTEKKLKRVGINSFKELKTVGSKEAFLRLRKIDNVACLSLLCGLEGAILRKPWHDLPLETKRELKAFHDSVKKSSKNKSK